MTCTDSCPITYSNALLKRLGASLSLCFKSFRTLKPSVIFILFQYVRSSLPLLLSLNISINLKFHENFII